MYNEHDLYFGHCFIVLDFFKRSGSGGVEVPTQLGSLGNALSVTGQWQGPICKKLYTQQSEQFQTLHMKKKIPDNRQHPK